MGLDYWASPCPYRRLSGSRNGISSVPILEDMVTKKTRLHSWETPSSIKTQGMTKGKINVSLNEEALKNGLDILVNNPVF